MSIIKVLTIIDRPGWAYARRAEALQKFAPEDIEIDVKTFDNVRNSWMKADVMLLLDYVLVGTLAPLKIPLIIGYNADPMRRQELFEQCCRAADVVVCNNPARYMARAHFQNVVCIPNGVDMEIFRPLVPIEKRPDRALWIGSARQQNLKRYDTVIQPLAKLLDEQGIESDFRVLRSPGEWMSTVEMVKWYNSGRYILCASKSEGTANTVLEGMACDCWPVSTNVGICEEMELDSIPPEPEQFMRRIEVLSLMPTTISPRTWLADAGYHWQIRGQYYYDLFRRIAENGPESIEPFSALEEQ
jgi:glycosyltransferase involved in cell wall biosynthesis